jgi:hypothetical protein
MNNAGAGFPVTKEEPSVTEADRARELREKIAAAEAKALAALPPETELQRLERQAAEAELTARNAQAIAEARSRYGAEGVGIAVVPTRLGVVILKRCDLVLWKRFQDLDDPKLEDFEKLTRPCVVHPSPTEYDRILDELPGAQAEITLNLAGLMGVRLKGNRGK